MNFVKSSETFHSTDVAFMYGRYQMADQNQVFQQTPQHFLQAVPTLSRLPTHLYHDPHAQPFGSYDGRQPLLNGQPTAQDRTQTHSGRYRLDINPCPFSSQSGHQVSCFRGSAQAFPSQHQKAVAQQASSGFAPYNSNSQNNTPSSAPQQRHPLAAGIHCQVKFNGPQPRTGVNIRASNTRSRPADIFLEHSVDGLGQGYNGLVSMAAGSHYSKFVRPERHEDYFEGGSPSDGSTFGMSSPTTTAVPCPARTLSDQPVGQLTRGAEQRYRPTASFGAGTFRPGSSQRYKRNSSGASKSDNSAGVAAATAAAAQVTREAAKPHAKCIVIPNQEPCLGKIKRLAIEVKNLKTERPNAVDKLYSASNRAHVHIHCDIESGPVVRGTGTFFCSVQFDGINVAVFSGLNKRTAKIEAFEIALKKILKPYLRIVEIDGCQRELQASDKEFSPDAPVQTVVKPMSAVIAGISADNSGFPSFSIQKESNVEAITNIKKRNYVAKDLREFVLVEPQHHNSSVNGASILRRSADFSKMLLEYDFAAHGVSGAIRCVLRVEGQVLADIIGANKPAAKIEASQRAVDVLRHRCWTILTKQAHDSNAPEITKDEIFSDLASTVGMASAPASMTKSIPDSNKGRKLLQKMGWTGGGIGKDGTGIEEPVAVTKVINREGLGLSSARGITTDFRHRVCELLESYAASNRQDDLIFSPLFGKDERVIIHNECRRLNLKSNSKSQGGERFLIVRRKRSASQLLEHIMACGGETVRYKILPPGQRLYPWQRTSVPSSTVGST